MKDGQRITFKGVKLVAVRFNVELDRGPSGCANPVCYHCEVYKLRSAHGMCSINCDEFIMLKPKDAVTRKLTGT